MKLLATAILATVTMLPYFKDLELSEGKFILVLTSFTILLLLSRQTMMTGMDWAANLPRGRVVQNSSHATVPHHAQSCTVSNYNMEIIHQGAAGNI